MLSWDDFNQEDTATTGAAVAPPPPPPVEASETPAPGQLPLEPAPAVNDASGSQGFAPQAEAPESTSHENALQKAIADLSSLDECALQVFKALSNFIDIAGENKVKTLQKRCSLRIHLKPWVCE